jgi:hypothetical protein
MTINEVLKVKKKKKLILGKNPGVDNESGLNVDNQRFMEEVRKDIKKIKKNRRNKNSGIDLNDTRSGFYDMKNSNYIG